MSSEFSGAQVAGRHRIIKSTDKVVLYGDSRFSTDFPINKTAWEALLGCTVCNNGIPGHVAAQNASNSDLDRIFNSGDGDPRLIVWLPGGNDTGAPGTVGTFSLESVNGKAGEPIVDATDASQDFPLTGASSFVQAIDHGVRKIISHYENCRVRAHLTGAESEAEKRARLDEVVRPIIVLVADLPQQRHDRFDPYSLSENWERKREAILEVALRNRIPAVDPQRKIPINMALEPFFAAPTDTTVVNGNLYYDGLHPYLLHVSLAELCVMELGL